MECGIRRSVSGLMGHTDFARQTRTTFATGLQSERGEQISGAIGAPRVASQGAIEAFGEDPPRAGRHVAEPTPATNPHAHGLAAPGGIERVTLVPTVLATAQLTTLWTRHG